MPDVHPLEGIRVLDLSRVLAGPFAGRLLSDLGADVVKVEPPEGDVTRIWGRRRNGVSAYFNQQNAGKRAVSIDLKVDGGAELVRRLAAEADVVIQNFRPGVMTRLGLDWPALQAVNPRLVMLSISGFGQEGPEAHRPAYAQVIHAESGVVARQAATAGGEPALALSVADTNAGLHGVIAILAALRMRDATGAGQHIDLAMLDALLVTDDYLHTAVDPIPPEPVESLVWDAPGGPIVIAAALKFLWHQLSRGVPLEDPAGGDVGVEEKIRLRRDAAQAWMLSFPDRQSLTQVLERLSLAWGDIKTSAEALESPTVRARGTIVQVDDGAGGTRPVVQTPYRFSAADSGATRRAGRQGEHNAEALADWLGLDAAAVDALTADGVLTSR